MRLYKADARGVVISYWPAVHQTQGPLSLSIQPSRLTPLLSRSAAPRHQAEVLDTKESGGHVRAGYTKDDYRNTARAYGVSDRACGWNRQSRGLSGRPRSAC